MCTFRVEKEWFYDRRIKHDNRYVYLKGKFVQNQTVEMSGYRKRESTFPMLSHYKRVIIGDKLMTSRMIYVKCEGLTGCLAAATAAAAAAAFIAPALGYIPTSNTRAHRLQHTPGEYRAQALTTQHTNTEYIYSYEHAASHTRYEKSTGREHNLHARAMQVN